MPPLQLQMVAGEWQSDTTVRGDAIHRLRSSPLSAVHSNLYWAHLVLSGNPSHPLIIGRFHITISMSGFP